MTGRRSERAASRRWLSPACAAAGVIAVVLVGCGGGNGSGDVSPTAVTTATQTVAVAKRKPPPPSCRSRSLRLSLKDYGAGAGTRFYLIVLRNRGRAACSLSGYPGVSLLDAHRRQIGPSARRTEARGKRFTVQPGRAGSAAFTVSSLACGEHPPNSRFLRVYPPDETHALVMRVRLIACKPSIRSLRAGTKPPAAG